MKLTCLFLFLFCCSCKDLYAQTSKRFYEKVFHNQNSRDYNKAQIRLGIVQYIDSLIGGDISPNEIAYLKFEKTCYIQNYGKVDILKLHLKDNAPSILFRNFLIIISHCKKEISGFNVTHYFLIRKRSADTAFSICVITDFRSSLGFSMVGCKDGELLLNNFINIFSADNCNQYKYGSLSIDNSDLDHDGFLKLRFNFDILSYCNINGGPYEKPVSKRMKTVFLIFSKTLNLYKKEE